MILRISCSVTLVLAAFAGRAEEPIPAGAFSVADDLEVMLWAHAPQFFNPTNIDVDIRGRVWVAEAVNYRRFKTQHSSHLAHETGDRIVVLEDTDGDGRADASTVFVQDRDLVAPLGVAVIGNRVVVSCSPSLIVYTDINEDARFDPAIDKKDVLLTGFGGLDHDHGLHAVVAGPDGRWYFNVGNAGSHTVTDRAGWTLRAGSWYTGGTPYNTKNVPGLQSDDGRVYVGGLAMSLNPDGTGLSVYAHNFRNNYETCVDSFGNVFQNDNDDQVMACRTTWLMQYANAGYSSADGRRSWQADQRPGQSVPRAHWHQDDPGVLPMGDLYGAGSPTGMAVYESDALGPDYRGMLLSCEAGRNGVFGYRVRAKGAGFSLERFSLLSSGLPDNASYKWSEIQPDKRRWFRPSDVAIGPDGAIYVADWYDPIVGGHAMHDQVGSGAIYRIISKARRLSVPQIDFTTTSGQIAALKSPAPNVRFLGFERLHAAGERSLAAVKPLLEDSNPYVRARAIWLMSNFGVSGRQAVAGLLTHRDAERRLVALRALRQAQSHTELASETIGIRELRELASDSNPAVRREVALTLRDIPLNQSGPLLEQLAKGFDGRDRWYLEAWGVACDGREEEVYAALARAWNAPAPLDWNDSLAALVWRLHPQAAITPLAIRAVSDRMSKVQRRQAIDTLAFIASRRAAETMAAIAAGGPEELRAYANWWIGFRRHNLWQSYRDVFPSDAETATLTGGDEAIALERILVDANADADVRKAAAEKMACSPAGGMRLVFLAAQSKLPKEFAATIWHQMARNPHPAVQALAGQFFTGPAVNNSDLPPLADLATMPGDAARGRQLVFGRAECVKCHRFGQEGKDIGPNLSGIGLKLDRQRLLDAILNPSKDIALGFETWLLALVDGRVISGFVLGEGDPLLVKDAEGKPHAIPADQIEFRQRQQATSLMPDLGKLDLSPQELSDIAEFLLQQRELISAAAQP